MRRNVRVACAPEKLDETDACAADEILVERRLLGQTMLKVKPGQVGTSNATKKENLGVLDYAHLRAPLPKDLAGSGIFSKGGDRRFPDAYFLMVGRQSLRDRTREDRD